MNKAIWVLQLLVAFAFMGAGGTKLVKAGDALRADPNMGWANDFTDTQLKLIGGAEVAGAVGLIAPAATGIASVLTPVAGVSLGVLMGGAAATHARRGEPPVAPLILGLLAISAGLLRWREQRRRAVLGEIGR